MYAIKEELKKINGEVVETFRCDARNGDTVLRVEAGTTGYRGQKRADGGRTFLSIEGMCGDFHFDTVTDEDGNVVGMEIACCGDDGLNALLKALAFASQAMNDQLKAVND